MKENVATVVKNMRGVQKNTSTVGTTSSKNEALTAKTNIVIVIPYRDREVHYKKIMKHLPTITRTNWNITTIVVEQADEAHFRRAWLLNIGIAEARKRFADDETCVVTHDIDMLADSHVDYAWCDKPTQICSELSCFNGGVPYTTSGGGVVQATLRDWYTVNGFTNKAFGWGGEDDDLHHRFRQNHMLTQGHLRRPKKGFGKCHCMNDRHHTKRVTHSVEYNNIVKQIGRLSRGSKEWKSDGLSSLQYNVVESSVDSFGTHWFKVNDKKQRDFLLFTSAGDKSSVARWLSKDRTYDIVVVYYGDKTFDYAVDEIYYRKDTKFPNLKWYMQNHTIDMYRAIAVWDDDIQASSKQIDFLFKQMLQSKANIFSPCHTRGNFASLFKFKSSGWRHVDFVEMNAPMFNRDELIDFMSVFDSVIKGWGTDIWYSHRCNVRNDCSIVVSDSMCVTNPKTRADGTREIEKAQPSPIRAKMWRTHAKNVLKIDYNIQHTVWKKGYDKSNV